MHYQRRFVVASLVGAIACSLIGLTVQPQRGGFWQRSGGMMRGLWVNPSPKFEELY